MNVTGKELKEMYDYYNKCCFNNELPSSDSGDIILLDHLNIEEDMSSDYFLKGKILGLFYNPRRRAAKIEIDCKYIGVKFRVAKTLIHEMVHFYCWFVYSNNRFMHGPEFRYEYNRAIDNFKKYLNNNCLEDTGAARMIVRNCLNDLRRYHGEGWLL